MSNKKIFIVVAPTGSIPKYRNPLEPKYISDLHLHDYLNTSQISEFISKLTLNGWERTEAGGIRMLAKPTYITVDLLRSISNDSLLQKLIIHLTSYGWVIDKSGGIHILDERMDSYIPPKLLKIINEFCTFFTDQLLAEGWEIVGSGYYLPSAANSPYVPVNPESIVAEANACFNAGAAIIHIHTRTLDEEALCIEEIGFKVTLNSQKNYIDEKQYELIVPELFKHNPTAILNLSTSIRGDSSPGNDAKRREHLKNYANCDLIPDIGSFSVGPVVFAKGGGYDNLPSFISSQKRHMLNMGIRPELEVFNHTILKNILTDNALDIESCGTPCLFMLVVGVDQSKNFNDNSDDSLIPSEISKLIIKLLQGNTQQSRQKALTILLEHLKPIVISIREKFSKCKIAVLTAGIMQTLLADLAVGLDLDGVRVGLEDTLNIHDDVPGGIRRSISNLEQVQHIKAKLEKLNYKVLNSEELRQEIEMQKPEIKLFKQIIAKLSVYAVDVLNPERFPVFSELQNLLAAEHEDFKRMENLFIADVMSKISSNADALMLSNHIKNAAYFHGVYIRYLIEEKDRYDNFASLKFDDLYILQNLNFMRQLMHERGMSYTVFDEALIQYSKVDARIKDNQFKTSWQRFLEYLTSIPCRYNFDRTNVVNNLIRNEKNYSETMAILFYYIKQMMLDLRGKSRSDKKNKGIASYVVGKQTSLYHDWIVVPSTVTTNYALGLQLSKGLSDIFYRTLSKLIDDKDIENFSILTYVHAGREQNDEDIIEATMLYNRFANNCDNYNSLTTFSSRLIAEHLLLPRIVKYPERMLYDREGLVKRNANNIPIYIDGSPVVKIETSCIDKLQVLKLLAHSSGITTAQQWDNILFQDMQKLGFTVSEQIAVFNRAVILSFASASDVMLNNIGTPVIDLTACNDIRSLAGTTTDDYLCHDIETHNEFIKELSNFRNGIGKIKFENSHAKIIYKIGKKGKRLLRIANLFLMDDPLRLHDGHSIKRYLTDMPEIASIWLSFIMHAPSDLSADLLLEHLHALSLTYNNKFEVHH